MACIWISSAPDKSSDCSIHSRCLQLKDFDLPNIRIFIHKFLMPTLVDHLMLPITSLTLSPWQLSKFMTRIRKISENQSQNLSNTSMLIHKESHRLPLHRLKIGGIFKKNHQRIPEGNQLELFRMVFTSSFRPPSRDVPIRPLPLPAHSHSMAVHD